MPKFIDHQTLVCADWLNAVDLAVYTALGQPDTRQDVIDFLDIRVIHNLLDGLDAADAHPTSAITGLDTTITGINAAIAANTAAIATKVAKAGDTMTGPLIVSLSSADTAVRITQAGAGNALVVEDSTNPDATPFVIAADGKVILGAQPDISLPTSLVRIIAPFTGDVNAKGINIRSVVQSDVTAAVEYYSTNAKLASGSYTLAKLTHFEAGLDLIGSGATITSQLGFEATVSIVGATYNYGFYGAINLGANNRWNFYAAGSAPNYFAGSVGIGINSPVAKLHSLDTAEQLRLAYDVAKYSTFTVDSTGALSITAPAGVLVTSPLTNTGAFGIASAGTVQSDLTGYAYYFLSRAKTAGAPFTLGTLYHYCASQQTFGASSAVTNQMGFAVLGNLTGASYNYSFYSELNVSGTKNWNFFANGTAPNFFNGSLGVGTATISAKLHVWSTAEQLRLGYSDSVYSKFTVDSIGNLNIAPTGGTVILASNASAALRITNTGVSDSLIVEDSNNPDSTPFVISSDGKVGIGATPSTNSAIYIGSWLSGNTTMYGMSNLAYIQSDVTAVAMYYRTWANTKAAAFTLGSLIHYAAQQGSFGSGSAVTDQIGFYVESSLTGAVNNYGFYSCVPAAANRWNFYASGTAPNYFAGDVRLGDPALVTQGGGRTNQLQFSSMYGRGIGLIDWSADAVGQTISFSKSRGATIGTRGLVINGDKLGQIIFDGDDGAAFGQAASIYAEAAGVPALNSMPGRLVFCTSPTGATSLAVRASIDANGTLVVGDTVSPSSNLSLLTIGGKSVNLGMPADSWSNTGIFVESVGTAGILYSNGSYRASWSCNGYRNSSGTWTSLGINATTGAAMIEQDPSGVIYFRTTASLATGGSYALPERMRIDNVGRIGIGNAPNTVSLVRLNSAITGAVASGGYRYDGTVSSDVTTSAVVFQSYPAVTNAVFTLTTLRHFAANQQTFGASATVTSQYGFFSDASLNGATNNYGFFSNLPASTGRWNFYAGGDAANYFAGRVLIGSNANANTFQSIVPSLLAEGLSDSKGTIGVVRNGADQYGPYIFLGKSRGTASAAVTLVSSGDELGGVRFFGADGAAMQPSSAIYGFVDDTAAAGSMPGRLTFFTTPSGTSSLVERMRIDNVGAVGIGGAPSAGRSFSVSKIITGSTTSSGIISGGVVQSDVTSSATYYLSAHSTQATTFTLGTLYGFYAGQGTIGAGSTVTSQYGFAAASTLTGATNNYGFHGNIPAATNAWNFYAAGTAQNYFSGNVGVGTTTISAKVHSLATTEQLRLGYDATNYTSFTVDSSGSLLIKPSSNKIRMSDTARTPATAGATGAVGEMCWDSGYVYVCVAANTWKRAALATW